MLGLLALCVTLAAAGNLKGYANDTRLFTCNPSAPTQQWAKGTTGNEIIALANNACLDVEVQFLRNILQLIPVHD